MVRKNVKHIIIIIIIIIIRPIIMQRSTRHVSVILGHVHKYLLIVECFNLLKERSFQFLPGNVGYSSFSCILSYVNFQYARDVNMFIKHVISDVTRTFNIDESVKLQLILILCLL